METILAISTDWQSDNLANDRKANLVQKLVELTNDNTFTTLLTANMPDQIFLSLASKLLCAYGYIVDITERLFTVKKVTPTSQHRADAISYQWDPSIDETEEVWLLQNQDD